jgi:hypothetical protein
VTDAGLRLLERLRSAIDQIAGALEDLNQESQRPIGRLPIYANHVAATAVTPLRGQPKEPVIFFAHLRLGYPHCCVCRTENTNGRANRNGSDWRYTP